MKVTWYCHSSKSGRQLAEHVDQMEDKRRHIDVSRRILLKSDHFDDQIRLKNNIVINLREVSCEN